MDLLSLLRSDWSVSFSRVGGPVTFSRSCGCLSRSKRYSHVRMEAKRRALDEIAARQNAADEKRKAEAERRQEVAVTVQLAAVQYRH